LLDVLRPNLPERSFRDGDILLRQGEQGTHLMYLLQGQVEVLVKLQPLRESGR
jgi:CRP-like cAMP-binding protein